MNRLALFALCVAFTLPWEPPPLQARPAPHAVVGKPRIITTTVRGALFPPSQYDKPYDGELEIRFFSNAEDLEQACKGVDTHTACTTVSVDHKKCWIFTETEDVIRRKGWTYAFVLRHELAHCNGWKHPNTTDGQKFKVGEAWDKAEGGKWIAVSTKVSMPKLPAITRMLPASPPVVCVTPDWKPEPCAQRAMPAWASSSGGLR
jgi:hypothetical protein